MPTEHYCKRATHKNIIVTHSVLLFNKSIRCTSTMNKKKIRNLFKFVNSTGIIYNIRYII